MRQVSQKLVSDIVRRARAGDQIAQAMIAETSHRAQCGDPKARERRKVFGAFISKNPPEARWSGFGADEDIITRIMRKGRELADRFSLLSREGSPNPNVRKIAARFSGEEHGIFCSSMLARCPMMAHTRAGFAGSALSYAVRLQAVRNGGSIRLLSESAHWELT
jgi:hypothetical protein